MPGLGSVTEGMVGTQLDLQNLQLGQAKLAEAPVKLEQERVDLQKDKISLVQQMTMLRLMQNLKPGEGGDTPDSMAGLLNQMATIQLESGMPDAAAKTAGEASRIQENASKIDFRTYKMQTDRFSKFANILGGVPDSPAGFAQAIQTMAAEDPRAVQDQKFQSIIRKGWSPGMIPLLQRSVLSAKDQAEIAYRNAAKDHAAAAAVLDKDRVGLIAAQTKLATAREVAVRKEGGAIVKARQLQAITDQATRDYTGADPADIRVRSRPIAEEMIKLVRDQHLTESEAAIRAYEKAKTAGVFGGMRQTPIPKGSAPGVALSLPSKASEVKQNQYYMVGGVPKIAIGTKFYTEEELAGIDKEDDDLLKDDEDEEPAR